MSRSALFIVLLAFAPPQEERVGDTVSTWTYTRPELDVEPRGYRVYWIHWNSAFRDTDLRIRDRIIGVDGKRYDDDVFKNHYGIGVHGENHHWEKLGKKDNDPVELMIWRDGKELTIKGKLTAQRFWLNEKNRQKLSKNGPERLKNDGFRKAWASWYEDFTRECMYHMALGWDQNGFHTRKLLKEHDAQKPRIDYLLKNHPGPLADAMLKDWKMVRECLNGERREITEADLEYRVLAERRAAEVKKAGQEARKKFVEEVKKNLLTSIPSYDPLRDDIKKIEGKLVELPLITQRNLFNDLGRAFYYAGSGRSMVFMDAGEDMKAFWEVWIRYRRKVQPNLRETYRFIGKVQPDPIMLTVHGSAVTGLKLKVVAASVGNDAFFVDLRKPKPEFAGEAELKSLSKIEITDKSTPKEVVEAMIESIKYGDQEKWESLFGEWLTSEYSFSDQPRFNPSYYTSSVAFGREWERSRKNLLGQVYDAFVETVGPVKRMWTRTKEVPIPTIERVIVRVSVVGKFGEEYRTFSHFTVRRFWVVERLDGGPWKIMGVNSL